MFGPKIKLPLGRIRRAAQTDVPAIEELITKECRFIFGNVDIGILIETATLAVSQLDTANNLIGFIALFDYPNVPALPQSDWPNWCSTIYRQNLQPHGTLFIHLMAWDKIFNWTFLKSVFTCIFMNDFYLQHIVMVMPPDSPFSIFPDDSIFCEVFIKTVAPEFKDATRFQCLYITQRQKWAPRMKIRKAVEEDNDDIIPIIDRQCDQLRQLYGDFYISELVALQNNPDNTRVMLVAEHDAFAVGVMVLNSVANLDYLHEKYELGPFWGLRKVTPEEKARMAENTYKEVTNQNMVLQIEENYLYLKTSLIQMMLLSILLQFRPNIVTLRLHFKLIHQHEEAWTRKQNVVRKTSLLHQNHDLILKDSQIKGAKPYHFLKDTNAGHTMHEDVEDQSSQVSESGGETNSTFSKPVDFEGGPEKSAFGESRSSVNSSRATNCTVKERDSSNLSEVFLYDSDDSLEFDIMNVDKKLLRVPDILSYDTYYSGYRRHPQRSVEKEPIKKKMFRKVRSSVFRAESKITVPVYSGGPNAFVIEIFAFHEDHDERHGFDILEVAFEIFPDLDYCILSIPTDVTIYPLLEHFTFVCPRPFTCLTQALYLIHRNSILGKLRMRLADPYDSPSIALLSQNAPRSKEVMEIFHSTVQTRHSTHASQSYVLLSEEQVVGVAIIDVATEEEMCLVRTKYSVAGRAGGVKAPDGVGSVSVLLLQPAMQTHARFFARELLRCSGHEGLFWTLRLRERIDASPGRDLISTIAEFVPSHPRRTISYDYDALPDFKVEVDSLSRVRSPYALWFINARICSLPKIDINRNIVLVGASKTALAFLEELLFGPSSAYLTFTNITLVSPHGIPTAVNCTRAADHMQPYMGRYNDRFFKSVPFICYVNVIAGTMTAINRADKFITVNTDQLFYDMLFLFCGEQYQHPDYLRDAMEVEKSYLGGKKYFHWSADNPARKSFENVVPPDPPENVFIVNDIIDANRSLNQLREIIGERKEYTVLVYGSTIHAYCCITALLELGVPGSNIKFFEPFPPENPNIHRVNFFNSPEVDLRVNDSIRAQGVSIYEGYYFEEWLVNEESGLVHSVKFLSYYMEVIVPCIAMFYYGTKGVNVNTFTAVNDAGLVYDGRLVINLDFETNDPYIYAAGPLTKYSRKYYADNFLHKYFSGCEIGKKVGEMIRNRLDPFKDESMEPTFNSSVLDQGIAFAASSNAFFNRSGLEISSSIDMSGIYTERDLDSRSGTTNDMTSILEQPAQELFYAKQHKRSEIFARFELPRFKEPLVTACIFPGGLNYLYVTKPGPQIPLAAAIEMRTTYGHVIETEENGYFRLHLNMDKKVETITCLTRETLDVYNLVSLWGKHEKLLNNMIVRYELDTIDNLYDYFKEPWCYAVFHDRFEELLQYIRDVIPPKMGHHGKTLKEEVDMMTLISNLQATVSTGAADLETVVNDLATNLRRKYDNFGYKSIIMDALLEWVDDNEDLLPMYAHPRLIRTLVLDLCHSPAFNVID